MSQEQIIKVLKKTHEPLSSGEIAKIIDDKLPEVCRYLRKLVKYKEICFAIIDKEQAKRFCKIPRTMRIYFIKSKSSLI